MTNDKVANYKITFKNSMTEPIEVKDIKHIYVGAMIEFEAESGVIQAMVAQDSVLKIVKQ